MNWRRPLGMAMIPMLVIALTGAPGCASRTVQQDPNTGRMQPQIDQGGVDPQEEVQVGRQAAKQIAEQLPVLPENHEVTRYVKQLGEKLAAKAPGFKYPYNFHVVNQKEINAFALPGGEIFINLGTMQMADEAELAGVMAHEIAHVAMRHSVEQAQKAQWIQLPAAILGGVLGGGSLGGQLAQMGIALGANGIIMKYSRDAETEADLVGSQIMYDAGFNPYSMVEFFQVLEKESGGGGPPQFLSDHPNPGNRAETVSKAIAKFPKKQYQREDSSKFLAIKRVADKMNPLTAEQIAQQQKSRAPARMGVPNAGDVMPAGGAKELDGRVFRIQYPANWEVMGSPEGGSVTIAPRAGVSQNAVAYGVVINAISAPQRQASMDEVSNAILQQLARENPDMRAAGNPQDISVNGAPARIVPVQSTSPIQVDGRQVAERDLVVVVQRPENSYLLLVFVAPEQDFAKLQSTYEGMLRSLQVQ